MSKDYPILRAVPVLQEVLFRPPTGMRSVEAAIIDIDSTVTTVDLGGRYIFFIINLV